MINRSRNTYSPRRSSSFFFSWIRVLRSRSSAAIRGSAWGSHVFNQPKQCTTVSPGPTPVRLKGEKHVNVSNDETHVPLRVFVSDDNGNNILGRDWIRRLHLHERPLQDLMTNVSICQIQPEANQLNRMIDQHKAIFKEGVGLCTVKAHLSRESRVHAEILQTAIVTVRVSTTRRNRFVHEWSRQGVLEPVDTAKWAAPIVRGSQTRWEATHMCRFSAWE